MERIFIDREWCINYVLLALNDIESSENKETTVKDFIDTIRKKFEIHTDDDSMKSSNIDKLKKKLNRRQITIYK